MKPAVRLAYFEPLDEHQIKLGGEEVYVVIMPSDDLPLMFSMSICMYDDTLIYEAQGDIKSLMDVAELYLRITIVDA